MTVKGDIAAKSYQDSFLGALALKSSAWLGSLEQLYMSNQITSQSESKLYFHIYMKFGIVVAGGSIKLHYEKCLSVEDCIIFNKFKLRWKHLSRYTFKV